MKKLILILLFITSQLAKSQMPETSKQFTNLDAKTLLPKLFDVPSLTTKNQAKWKPNFAESIAFSYFISDDSFCYTSFDTILQYKQYEQSKAIVIFKTIKYDKGSVVECHACGVNLSLALFTKNPEGMWVIDAFEKDFIANGSYGKRKGTMSIQQAGTNIPVLAIKSGIDGNQGYFSGFETYYSLDIYQGIKPIFDYTYYDSDEGASGTKGEVKTTMRFIPVDKSYSTIELTEKSNKKSQPVITKYKYNVQAGCYVKM